MPDTVYEFVLGFKDLANRLGKDVVGTPVESEHYGPDGTTGIQTTTKGVMWYSKVGNQAGFIPFV